MNKILIILALFISVSALAQDDPYMPQKIKTDTGKTTIIYQIQNKSDSIAYELDYLRYNLGRFHSTATTGIVITLMGTIISGIGLIMPPNNSDTGILLTKVGAGISGFGALISATSYLHLKRASIKPSRYGVSLNYNF
jgi:hypothetical protein